MNGVALASIIPAIQFVEGPGGGRLAVMDADDWDCLVEWLEDVEDQRIVRSNVDRLRVGPEAFGAISLESILWNSARVGRVVRGWGS